MKNWVKKLALIPVVAIALSSAYFPYESEAQTTTGNCTAYTLVWTKDGSPVDPTNDSDFTNPPNTVFEQAPDLSGSTPFATPTLPVYTLNYASSTHITDSPPVIGWVCSGGPITGAGILSNQETQNPPGMESCTAAAEIAQKYAWYTTVGSPEQIAKNVGAMLLPQLQNKFASALSSYKIDLSGFVTSTLLTNIFGTSSVSVSQLGNFFSSANIQNVAQKILTNPNNEPLKSINGQINDIKQGVENQAKQVLTQVSNNVAGQLTSETKALLNLSTVPVYDQSVESAVNKSTEATKQVNAEQKNQETIADTRAKCDLLLKQTVETIKRSLLYQFTTETVDWIQNGGIQIKNGTISVNAPQYFQRPWKDLADAGLNAVDRLISNIAPQLCQPFRLSVTLQIPSVARETNPFYQQVSCTLNQVLQNNIQGFYNDFRTGGWVGYQEIMMPQNNYYGESAITQQLASQASAAATTQLQNQMNQGNGYKNQYECDSWLKFTTTSSLTGTSPVTQQWVNNNLYYGYPVDLTTTTDGNGNVVSIPKDAGQNMQSSAYKDANNRFFTSSSSDMFYDCLDSQGNSAWSIAQPSNISAGLAQQATQADITSIINAQDLTDIGSILQNAIINKLTKVGVGGLKGVLQKLPAWTGILQIKAP